MRIELLGVAALAVLIGFVPIANGQDDASLEAVREFQQSKKYKKQCERNHKRFENAQPAETNTQKGVRPYCRFPPQFPDRCESGAKSTQYVKFLFDVTGEGYVVNIRMIDTDNECFIVAAARSLALWKYEETEMGATDLETTVTFQLQG